MGGLIFNTLYVLCQKLTQAINKDFYKKGEKLAL